MAHDLVCRLSPNSLVAFKPLLASIGHRWSLPDNCQLKLGILLESRHLSGMQLLAPQRAKRSK